MLESMFANATVAPEQKKALTVLERSLPFLNEMLFTGVLEPAMFLVDDQKFFCSHEITAQQLPRGSWLWNQSRTKQTVRDNSDSLIVSFYKLNTRRSTPRHDPAPAYKVWVYRITFLDGKKDSVTFYWCERGKKPEYLDEKLLQNLSFLRPYVSQSTATEFGWIRQEGYSPSTNKDEFLNVKNTCTRIDYSNFSVFHGNT
mmetsp:Transcript_36727/g.63085  ORF Transcript_36727/g.63085 Transcript_36727/m.63085 type:complete len:200 (+) Transcript_36727:103-702(+)